LRNAGTRAVVLNPYATRSWVERRSIDEGTESTLNAWASRVRAVAPAVRLSLVVSTVGRVGQFARLLDSVAASPVAAAVEVVLVDQSEDGSCAALLDRRGLPGPTQVTTSGLGVSTGRNVGLKLASGPIVAFPDDDCWYPQRALGDALDLLDELPGWAGLSGRQLTTAGAPSMLRWHRRAGEVTRRNFMRTTISSTLFLRRAPLDAAGHFDEGMGVGAAGFLGAGEDSDLVLRLLAGGQRLAYRPEVVVLQDDTRVDPPDEFVEKMLRYGSGHGHLWRRHRLGRTHLVYMGARKVASSALRASCGQTVLARADLAWLRGITAGWRGVPPKGLTRERKAPR
jgi:GT2 family glycosyltransferase